MPRSCYDVCEMSITGYLLARRYGLPFTALPVFTVRGFPQSHVCIIVNQDAGVSSPEDLEGKRVGARAYTGTASLWVRGVLQDEYGVDLDQVNWVSAEEEHVPQYGQDAPSNVSYELGSDLASMLAEGNLAAAIGISISQQYDFQPMIPYPRQTAADFYRRTGIYQINHTIVLRDDLIRDHPGLSQSLYEAFVLAKHRWLETNPELPIVQELALPDGDPLPFGLEENAASIDALLRYAKTQGLTPSLMTPEELFPRHLISR